MVDSIHVVKKIQTEKIDKEKNNILIIVNIYLNCINTKVNVVNDIIEKENKTQNVANHDI